MENSAAPVPNRQTILGSYEPLESSYTRMIVEADQIPYQYNILASAAHWVLLAGYLVIPGTFTSLQKSNTVIDGLKQEKVGKLILTTIQNPPLLALAVIFFVVGIGIMGWLFWEHQTNYIWLVNRIIMPTLMNAAAGFLTTVVSLYTAHGGDWSIMALLTVVSSGISMASSIFLLFVYKFGKLERLKQEHNRAVRNHYRQAYA